MRCCRTHSCPTHADSTVHAVGAKASWSRHAHWRHPWRALHTLHAWRHTLHTWRHALHTMRHALHALLAIRARSSRWAHLRRSSAEAAKTRLAKSSWRSEADGRAKACGRAEATWLTMHRARAHWRTHRHWAGAHRRHSHGRHLTHRGHGSETASLRHARHRTPSQRFQMSPLNVHDPWAEFVIVLRR